MIEQNNIVYFARVVPLCDIYETLQLTIRTVHENWFVGVDTSTRQAFPFDRDDIGVLIFSDKKSADAIVKAAKKQYGTRRLTKIKEEELDEET